MAVTKPVITLRTEMAISIMIVPWNATAMMDIAVIPSTSRMTPAVKLT